MHMEGRLPLPYIREGAVAVTFDLAFNAARAVGLSPAHSPQPLVIVTRTDAKSSDKHIAQPFTVAVRVTDDNGLARCRGSSRILLGTLHKSRDMGTLMGSHTVKVDCRRALTAGRYSANVIQAGVDNALEYVLQFYVAPSDGRWDLFRHTEDIWRLNSTTLLPVPDLYQESDVAEGASIASVSGPRPPKGVTSLQDAKNILDGPLGKSVNATEQSQQLRGEKQTQKSIDPLPALRTEQSGRQQRERNSRYDGIKHEQADKELSTKVEPKVLRVIIQNGSALSQGRIHEASLSINAAGSELYTASNHMNESNTRIKTIDTKAFEDVWNTKYSGAGNIMTTNINPIAEVPDDNIHTGQSGGQLGNASTVQKSASHNFPPPRAAHSDDLNRELPFSTQGNNNNEVSIIVVNSNAAVGNINNSKAPVSISVRDEVKRRTQSSAESLESASFSEDAVSVHAVSSRRRLPDLQRVLKLQTSDDLEELEQLSVLRQAICSWQMSWLLVAAAGLLWLLLPSRLQRRWKATCQLRLLLLTVTLSAIYLRLTALFWCDTAARESRVDAVA